jgi:hypothetical protein
LLGATGQNLSGGVYSTSFSYATGNISVDFALGPTQYVFNNGGFTITAPAHDGSCLLNVINQASAGAITFAGFTVGSNTGDALDTTNGHTFTISLWGIHGVYSFVVKALQ